MQQHLESSNISQCDHLVVVFVLQLVNKVKVLARCFRPSRRRKMVTLVKKFVQSITIEPVVFLFQFGVFINKGSQLTTNLLIWKFCRIEMKHSEEICQHLTEESNSDIQIEVLKSVNHFLLTSQLLGSVPSIFFALIAGSLSDDFGRKPLIKWPLIGYFISSILSIINYANINTFPVEFFYFDQLWFFFGGMMVYYMGMYGYGTDITTPDERAYRLARLDGSEYLAMTIAPLIGPILFQMIGYYGCFAIQSATTLSAIIYLCVFIKEPPKKQFALLKPESHESISIFSIISAFFKTFVATPLVNMISTMTRKRPDNLRFLLLLQIIVYFLYWFSEGDGEINYLFMIKVFKSSPEDYSLFLTVLNCMGVIALFLVMPVLTGTLRLHETTVNVFITTSVGIGLFAAAFSKALVPDFYFAYSLTFMRICQYSAGRSIFTKTVDSDEVGKVFSAVAVVAAVSPFLSNLIFRLIYNQTIDTFPSSYLLLASMVFLVATVINSVLWLYRSVLNNSDEGSSKSPEDGEELSIPLMEAETVD